MRRPFARTFDLMSSEYGWTDEQLMNLTLSRLRQARSVVMERKEEENRSKVRLAEMMTRTLASFVAGGPGEKNHAAAKRIRFLEPREDEKELPSTEDVMRMFGG